MHFSAGHISHVKLIHTDMVRLYRGVQGVRRRPWGQGSGYFWTQVRRVPVKAPENHYHQFKAKILY